MEDLRRMAVFHAVVEANGFSSAARRLGMTKSAVSKHVALLEEGLGVRLLHRTTRSMRLTDAGRAFDESCARLVAAADDARAAVGKHKAEPLGTLRLAAPVAFETQTSLALAAFLERHPGLRAEAVFEDRKSDLVAEGFDVAIRAGSLAPSSLVARKLLEIPFHLCGSQSYLRRNGTPRSPRDLASHDFIVFSLFPDPGRLVFTRGGRRTTVRVPGRIRSNSFAAIQTMVRGGVGLAAVPSYFSHEDERAGRVEVVLPGWTLPPGPIHILYPPGAQLMPKVRLFVDHLVQWFSDSARPWQAQAS